MEDTKEITLKVKLDSYKTLQNYIHNELQIGKKDIEEMIERLIIKVVEKKLQDVDMNRHIEKVVRESVGKLSSNRSWNIENNVNNAIEKVIGEQIMTAVKEQLRGVDRFIK